MFGTVRFRNIRITALSLLCLGVFTAVCLIMLRAGAPDTVELSGGSYSLRADDEEDIRAFLTACGYDAGELLSDKEIKVPKIWNDTYADYNALMRSQGFDLVPYKGKPAREAVYAISGGGYVTLLISGGRIIGGHMSDGGSSDIYPLVSR